MNFHLDVKQFSDLEYYIILSLIGVLSALHEGAISIDDAERLIFSPRYAKGAKKLGVNVDIVKIIRYGTELEDIESLCPEKLTENILELKDRALALCSQISKPDDQLERMTVMINGTTHTMLKGFPNNIKFEDLEEE